MEIEYALQVYRSVRTLSDVIANVFLLLLRPVEYIYGSPADRLIGWKGSDIDRGLPDPYTDKSRMLFAGLLSSSIEFFFLSLFLFHNNIKTFFSKYRWRPPSGLSWTEK